MPAVPGLEDEDEDEDEDEEDPSAFRPLFCCTPPPSAIRHSLLVRAAPVGMSPAGDRRAAPGLVQDDLMLWPVQDDFLFLRLHYDVFLGALRNDERPLADGTGECSSRKVGLAQERLLAVRAVELELVRLTHGVYVSSKTTLRHQEYREQPPPKVPVSDGGRARVS